MTWAQAVKVTRSRTVGMWVYWCPIIRLASFESASTVLTIDAEERDVFKRREGLDSEIDHFPVT